MVKIKNNIVNIIGGGLAGSEAAWQIAEAGIKVRIYEMRPKVQSPAHSTENLAELVCSNSLRSDDFEYNAVGLMHEELRKCGSLIMFAADKHRVPAGGALAVDREGFSKEIQERLSSHPNVEIIREEVTSLPNDEDGLCIISSGPLTSEKLASAIKEEIGGNSLSFFDAIAPVIYKESIDFSVAWYQSRYDKGDAKDYINCPMNKEQYYKFIQALIDGEKAEFHEWEKDTPYFEGCLPIEVMAERGVETLSFGPMKPVGLQNPNNPNEEPYAVVQLRQDNAADTLRNMVGFQTKLKHGAQKEIFRTIPGLENAEFARLGGIHRNTFLNSPQLLDNELRLKSKPHIRFAGQITGCEGYVESSAMGYLCGYFTACEILEKTAILPPETTSLGAMLSHVTVNANQDTYQPMNINFGLFPPVDPTITVNGKRRKLKGKDRKKAYSDRALENIKIWLEQK